MSLTLNSLPGSCVGSFPNFPGQGTWYDRVPAVGTCLPDRLIVCGGYGPEFQQHPGTPRHGGQGEDILVDSKHVLTSKIFAIKKYIIWIVIVLCVVHRE